MVKVNSCHKCPFLGGEMTGSDWRGMDEDKELVDTIEYYCNITKKVIAQHYEMDIDFKLQIECPLKKDKIIQVECSEDEENFPMEPKIEKLIMPCNGTSCSRWNEFRKWLQGENKKLVQWTDPGTALAKMDELEKKYI